MQAPQLRESVAPVYHVVGEPSGHLCWPSNIAHVPTPITGTHACCGPHPTPTAGAAQNRIIVPQVSGPGVGVPTGAHDPVGVGTNALTCTP